ncbi:MAG: hypothetical protein ACTTKH_03190 [Treponema sp.]
MIKKGYLFSLVVFCSLFFLASCNNAKGAEEPELLKYQNQEVPFDKLQANGFIPPTIRLPDSYVNDKIENKAKKLSYDFYYYRIKNGEDFSSVDIKKNDKLEQTVFSPACIFHSTTISEEDAGLDSKAKVKYDKLREGNGGGDICIGTRFILGVKVKDQADRLVYHSITQYTVMAPVSTVIAVSGKKISVPGNQVGYEGTVTASDGWKIKSNSAKFDGSVNRRTIYELEEPSGTHTNMVNLEYGDFGKTNKVLITN